MFFGEFQVLVTEFFKPYFGGGDYARGDRTANAQHLSGIVEQAGSGWDLRYDGSIGFVN